jgi:hypothetical protein
MMTPRERMIAALERRPQEGRVPHFELVFFLTMEAFGRVHPSHRNYEQWHQMEEQERQLHRIDMAEIFIQTAETFEHDAIYIHPNPGTFEECLRMIDLIRDRTGDRYFLMKHGDVTPGIPDGEHMLEFSERCRVGQLAAENEIRDFLEPRIFAQVFYVVAAIGEDVPFRIDVAYAGRIRDDTLQPRAVRG